MKRLKLVLPGRSKTDVLLGQDARLFDADTGEELESAKNIQVRFPLHEVVTVQVEFNVTEIEVQ